MYSNDCRVPLQLLCNAPKLWDVMVAGYPPDYIDLPKGTITRLWLDHTSIRRALEIFRDSPHLKHCTVRITDTNELSDLPTVTALKPETMKFFGLNLYTSHFFDHLTTPTMRNLGLNFPRLTLAPLPGLIPDSLVSLHLSTVNATADMLIELFQATPKLRHFVDDLASMHVEDIRHVLDLTRLRNPQHSGPILPNLHSLLL
jgi:hypothetical protein